MKTNIFLITALAILVVARPLHAASEPKEKETIPTKSIDAISQVKLRATSLPDDLKIVKENLASNEQLRQVRSRVGFPVLSLMNQVLSSQNEQAQVNYLLVQDESWLDAGYSFLAEADGKKSMIFNKGNVIIELAATKPDLEARVAHLLGADPIQFLKLRLGSVPATWELMKEKIYVTSDLNELQLEVNLPVEAALSQEFGAGHTTLRINYYRCSDSTAGIELARQMAERKKPILKLLIGISGPLVVVAESQNEEINRQTMNLINWPNNNEVQMFPVVWE